MATFIKLEMVKSRTGLSKSSIYLMMKEGRFPQNIGIGKRAVAWVEYEIQQWIDSRIQTRCI